MSTLPPVDQMASGAQRPTIADGAETYKFVTPGDYVYGWVTARRDVDTKFGPRTIVELHDQQRGPIEIWISNVQLVNSLVEGNNQLRRPVAEGDLLYVRYDGQEQREGGKTLKNFAVNLAEGQRPQNNAVAPQQQPQQQQAPVYTPQQPQPQPQQWGQQTAPPPIQPQPQPTAPPPTTPPQPQPQTWTPQPQQQQNTWPQQPPTPPRPVQQQPGQQTLPEGDDNRVPF